MRRFAPAFFLCCLGVALVAQTSGPPPADAVISLNRSLNGRLHPVPVSAVKFPDGFWGARNRLVVDRVLPMLRQELEEHGEIDNFLRVAGKKNVPRKGRPSSDVDV